MASTTQEESVTVSVGDGDDGQQAEKENSTDISRTKLSESTKDADGVDKEIESSVDQEGSSVDPEVMEKECVSFKVVYNKQKYDVIFPLDDTVASLKNHLEEITSVPSAMQKIMFKGRMNDTGTLRDHKVTKSSKIMLVGSTVNDVLAVSAPSAKDLKEEEAAAVPSKEALCKQKPHKTVLEKHGKPDDVMIGVKKKKEPLPPAPIAGMYNKSGGKVRLTFKLEADQLWIGTKERTDKIPMGSIKAVVSEPIEGHEEYHMMGIQLGPTEASRYWVYWVPAQYVDAIKDSILGKWQFF